MVAISVGIQKGQGIGLQYGPAAARSILIPTHTQKLCAQLHSIYLKLMSRLVQLDLDMPP